jgi:tetratricopeptide (TPR) repeat protein
MSYIHDALKKAQREKDSLVTRYSDVWSSVRSRRRLSIKRGWLVSTCLIVVSVALSAYSWLHSLDELPLHPGQDAGVHRAIVEPPERPHSGEISESHVDQGAVNSQAFRVQREPTKRPLPANENKRKQTQEPEPPVARQPGPDQGMTLYSQALALQKEGRLEDAKKLYEGALERSPHLASALNNLGAIYIKEKNYDMARRMLEKAIQTEPGYVDPYYNLACLHALQNDVGRSLAYLKKATSVNEAVRQWAKTDEDLRNLRGHSEYEKIIQGA